MLYVHGTKVDFQNAVTLTAEIDHFAGKDFVGMAFSWPSHQNILTYLLRIDVNNARNSSDALVKLIKILAVNTRAKRINILAYSAGGRVTSKALYELRHEYDQLNNDELRDRFRLGSVVFAAADVEVDQFLERLPSISELTQQTIITVSDNDTALIAAKRFMGGKSRAGTEEAESIEIDFIENQHLNNVEIIDVSHGKEYRGFDIDGHHYWYRHPWMSSDIIFLMRTNLPPGRRGLSQSEVEGLWYLSQEYPDMIQEAVREELDGQW